MSGKRVENSVLTVSEIAEKAGVSRNKVWSFIRRNGIKAEEKEGNSFKFDSKIVLEIKEKQGKKQDKDSNKVNGVVSDTVLEILQKQLEIKDKQIQKQQETIDYFKNENLTLRLESSKQRKLLEDRESKLRAVSENDLERNKHWWQFWR
ncbi:replication protein B [Lactobacillus crispatus]|uniref:helix-turn-helix domain-containing protein n=1 Tax=Lactobacillus crispatus TaxID=47770 RepID=UPI0018E3761A|nr:helix-turn-helix domain-containing protein [Lactobacillus crispatus]MBI1698616.1 replication protein B [Lactobacillus crispatus]